MDKHPPPPYEAHLAAMIREAMQAQGVSENELAERTLIPRITLRRRLQGLPGIKITELLVIAEHLGLDAEDLVRQAKQRAA